MSTAEVWAQYQTRYDAEMAAESAGNSDLMSRGWNSMSEDESFKLSAEIQRAFNAQKAEVIAALLEGVDNGFLKRIRTHGGGGEWVAA